MDAPRLSRELLLADLVLARGLAGAGDVAAALQQYWTAPDAGRGSFEEVLTQHAGVAAEALAAVRAETEDLIAQAGGDARRALAARGPTGQAIRLTLGAQRAPGRTPDGSTPPAEAAQELRVAPDGRFSECLVAGEGGMGVVYMAFDTDLKRFVALKMIRPPGPDGVPIDTPHSPFEATPPAADTESADRYAELQQRFLQEAWITGGLEHPGIVPVYELGRTSLGMPFYTMRFISGHRTLADAIKEVRGAPVAERLALLEPFLKICDAVEYAHVRFVIHRDLKPSNVALGDFGEVLVLDWGLAKVGEGLGAASEDWQEHVKAFREAEAFETQLAAVGTPGYMAPEAALGDHAVVDARSDVYSLGVILYEILTGRLPHAARTPAAWLHELASEPVIEPALVDAAVPAGLSAIALTALAKVADERPASAGALAEAVRRWRVADEQSREVDRLERDAREALRAGDGARGDERLRYAERAGLLLRQAAERRPGSRTTTALLERAEALRRRALRERTWLVIRRPLMAAALLVLAFLGAALWREHAARSHQRAAVETLCVAAQAQIDAERPDEALRLAHEALVVLEDAEREGAAKPDWFERRRARLLELTCWAHALRGDVRAMALSTAERLARPATASQRQRYRTAAAAPFAEVGTFHVVRELLRELPLTREEDRRRLIDACLRIGERAAARRAAQRFGDAHALALLDRFTLLDTIPVPGAVALAVTELRGRPTLVVTTTDGKLLLWDGTARTPREVRATLRPTLVPSTPGGLPVLEDPMVHAFAQRPGLVLVVGRWRPDEEQPKVCEIQEFDLEAGTAFVLHRSRRIRARPRLLDLDGDGELERVLTYQSESRGLDVLRRDGSQWTVAELGDLVDLHIDLASPHANVEVFDIALAPAAGGGPPVLLAATGPWNTRRLGFGIVRYERNGPGGSWSEAGHAFVGLAESLDTVDLDGDGMDEFYLHNGHVPRVEFAPVRANFAHAGVHRVDPASLALDRVRVNSLSGYYVTPTQPHAPSQAYWDFVGQGGVRLHADQAALVRVGIAHDDALEPVGRRYVEVIAQVDGAPRTWVVADTDVVAGPEVCASADVLDQHAGEELIVLTKDAVLVLGAAPRAEGRTPDAALPTAPDTGEITWRLAEALERSGYHGVAAEIYESLEGMRGPGTQRTERWLRAVERWIAAGETDRAHAALAEASQQGGLDPIEALLWEGRIAAADHRAGDARRAYEHAARALSASTREYDLHRETLGADKLRAIEAEARERAEQLRVGAHRLAGQIQFDADAARPAGWQTARPRLAEPLAGPLAGPGLATALSGPRKDFMGLLLATDAPVSFRVRARLVVEEFPYGSRLCVGFSKARMPSDPSHEEKFDGESAAWVSLERGDGHPRGVGAGFRLPHDALWYWAEDDGRYLWQWGRPLVLEITYHRGLGMLRGTCLDEISGEIVGTVQHVLAEPMKAGSYHVGLWGTDRVNPWNREVRFSLHALEYEVTADGDAPPRILVREMEDAAARGSFDTAWDLWFAGHEQDAVLKLLTDVPPDLLARWLVGPRPVTATGLVSACLTASADGALARALLAAEGTGVERTRLDLLEDDPRLLVGLWDAEQLTPETQQEEAQLGVALQAVGRLKEARRWRAARAPRSLENAAPAERLHAASGFYEDATALKALLAPLLDGSVGPGLRMQALRACLVGALARGDEEAAKNWLAQLYASPALDHESLNDVPAIRRFLTETRR